MQNLECPYGIPDDQCCQRDTCPTYVARKKAKKQLAEEKACQNTKKSK